MLNLLQEVLFILDYQHECLKQLKVVSPIAEDRFKIIFFKITRKIVEELNLLDRATHLLQEEQKLEESAAVIEEDILHNQHEISLEDSISPEVDKTSKTVENTESLVPAPSTQFNDIVNASSPSKDDIPVPMQTETESEVIQLESNENNVKSPEDEIEISIKEGPKRQKIVLKSGRVSGYIYESDDEKDNENDDIQQYITDNEDEYAPDDDDEHLGILGKGDSEFELDEYWSDDDDDEKKKYVKYVKCTVCGEKIKSSALKHHMDRHNGVMYPCDQCDKTFTTSAYIRKHKMNFHMEIEPLECEICKKKLKNWESMKLHIKLVHEKAFACQCDICGQVITDKRKLEYHIANAHERKTLKCDDCGKLFGTKHAMSRHIREVHSAAGHVSCDFCGKTFTRESNLRVHIRIHTGEKPFVCDICGAAFVQNVELRLHNNKHVKEKAKNLSKIKIVNQPQKRNAIKQKTKFTIEC